MSETNRAVSFTCQNSDCDEEIDVSLNIPEVPGWALCNCGYGYIVDRSCSTVRVVDDEGEIEVCDDILMQISLTIEEQMSIDDCLQGRVFHHDVRSEFLAMVSEQGAITLDSIPVPIDTIEEQGLDLPEAYIIKVALTAAPPALKTISQYYSQEVITDIEEFEA
jgi:hypothetical protein